MITEGSEAWRDLLGQRGYGSAPKAVPLKRDWRNGIYPAPVYVATFPDGKTVRMSFWSRAGKPLDYDRGRRLCEHWHDTIAGEPGLPSWATAGHVEVNDAFAGRDPFFIPHEVPPKTPARKRVTTKRLKATLAAIIHLPELPADQQTSEALRLVAEARELIAA